MTAKVCTAKVGTDLSAIRAQARKHRRNATKRRNRRVARLKWEQNALLSYIENTPERTFEKKLTLLRVMLEIRQLRAN
jgi:hypothetical protein